MVGNIIAICAVAYALWILFRLFKNPKPRCSCGCSDGQVNAANDEFTCCMGDNPMNGEKLRAPVAFVASCGGFCGSGEQTLERACCSKCARHAYAPSQMESGKEL